VSILPNQEPGKTGKELYRRYLDGDEKAFEELVGLYERDLALFINGIVGDIHETKHLLIDTFAQLAVSGGRFEGMSALKTYLFAIGKHLALRHVKLRGRETHLSVSTSARRLRHCAKNRRTQAQGINDGINSVLAVVGEKLGVNRHVLFLKDQGKSTFTNTHEWCDERTRRNIGQFDNVDITAATPSFIPLFEKEGMIVSPKNKSSRCAFCKRPQLLENPEATPVVWEHIHELTGRRYIVYDCIIQWEKIEPPPAGSRWIRLAAGSRLKHGDSLRLTCL